MALFCVATSPDDHCYVETELDLSGATLEGRTLTTKEGTYYVSEQNTGRLQQLMGKQN